MGFYGVGCFNSESHGYFSILFLKGQGLEGMNINDIKSGLISR